MHRLDQRFLVRTAGAFALILIVITLSATLSQAARLTADILERGLSLSQFAMVLLTMMPKMVELVIPLAFGIAMVLVCIHRNENGTTLLLRAAGRSPLVDGALVSMLGLGVGLGLLALSGLVVPNTQLTFRTLYTQAQANSAAAVTLPVSVPFSVGDNITLVIGAHPRDGRYEDLVAIDTSGREETVILRAAWATLSSSSEGQAVLELQDGSIQRVTDEGRQTHLSFTSTALSLDQLGVEPALTTSAGTTRRPDRVDTRSTQQLLEQQHSDAAARKELIRRLAAALSLVSFSVLTAAVLFGRRPHVNGQALAALTLIGVLVIFLLLQSALISTSGFSPLRIWLVLAISITPLILSPFIRLVQPLKR